MNTTMQELIKWINKNNTNDYPLESFDIVKKVIELLEKEKEQINDAYNQGTLDGESSMLEYPNYYKETYR